MKSRKCMLGVLGVCLLVSAGLSQEDDKKKATEAARKAILDLAQGKGDAKEIAKEHSLEFIMLAFKRKDKGGIGIGLEGAALAGKNGIEAKIIALAKRELTQGDLQKEAATLIKMAEITRAIADIGTHTKLSDDQRLWDLLMNELRLTSNELIVAIKSGDPKTVYTAARHLNRRCNVCHCAYRDD